MRINIVTFVNIEGADILHEPRGSNIPEGRGLEPLGAHEVGATVVPVVQVFRIFCHDIAT